MVEETKGEFAENKIANIKLDIRPMQTYEVDLFRHLLASLIDDTITNYGTLFSHAKSQESIERLKVVLDKLHLAD